MTGGVRTTAATASTMQLTTQTATHQWVFIYHNQHGRLRRREENRVYLYAAHSGKSEAEVTNKRRLRSTYCAIEANYWHTRSIARRVFIIICDSRATCFIPPPALYSPSWGLCRNFAWMQTGGQPESEKVWGHFYWFWHNTQTCHTDGWTDGHRVAAALTHSAAQQYKTLSCRR